MNIKSLKFDLQELGGALGDLGTLLPLMVALVLMNGLNATYVVAGVGLFYISSGLYFRIPTPVQPLKAVSIIAITMGLSASVIGAAGLLLGAILLFLSMTNLIARVVKLFPREVVRGIQLSIGLLLFKKGIGLTLGEPTFANGAPVAPGLAGVVPLGMILAVAAVLIFVLFRFFPFRRGRRFPASLALLSFGLAAGVIFGPIPGIGLPEHDLTGIVLPTAADFWLALTVLVVPQLPLTLGNAVVGARDTARTYFGDRAHRMTPRALTASMGLANVAAGLIGAMPMCHGSGGLTAHYRMGARTAGSNLMVGGLLLGLGVAFGGGALPFLSLIPLAVLGILLAIVGIYHAFLMADLRAVNQLAVAGAVALTTLVWGNLAIGFGVGIVLYYLLRRVSGRLSTAPVIGKLWNSGDAWQMVKVEKLQRWVSDIAMARSTRIKG